jgi:hypothetical protein
LSFIKKSHLLAEIIKLFLKKERNLEVPDQEICLIRMSSLQPLIGEMCLGSTMSHGIPIKMFLNIAIRVGLSLLLLLWQTGLLYTAKE